MIRWEKTYNLDSILECPARPLHLQVASGVHQRKTRWLAADWSSEAAKAPPISFCGILDLRQIAIPCVDRIYSGVGTPVLWVRPGLPANLKALHRRGRGSLANQPER